MAKDDAILLEGMSSLRSGDPILGAGVYRGELGSLGSPDFVAPEPGEEAEEFDFAESLQKFESTYSKAADPVSAMDQAALTRELEEAIDQQLRATRPGHDDDWYQTRIDERIRQHDFYPRNYAPAPPTPPSVDFLREVYQKYPDELRATYRPDSSIGRVIASLASDKSDDEIQELVDNTSVGEWPSEFTWGTGFLNAMQRGLSRRVIEVEAGADMPGREQRWEHRRQVARELKQIMDEDGIGAGISRMWNNGPSMDENDAYRAGLFLDEDEATARELTVTTSLGAAAGAAVRSKLGHLLPRGAVWGRRLGGLRSAAAGGQAGAPAGPVGILIGGVIGGFIGYGAGKIWGKVNTKEFFRPVPAFGSTTGDDSYYFALPKGLVDISSRLMVLTGLADVAHIPYLASNDEEADRMRDMIAMSRPSESWGSLVVEYRNARNSGKTSKELREELRPMMGGMVRNVAWADLPESARHTDKLDLAEAIDYAHSNRDMGDAGAPDFTFEYLVALINEGKTEKVRLQRVLDSLPIGQILKHVPYIIVGDEHQTGSIPSMDTFIDGVLVAAGDTEEAYSLTGVDTTRDLATGFAELMLERREVDGQVRYVENTPGKVFRVLSSIPELYFETRLPYDIPITPASRDFRYGLGIRDPDVGYWARVLSNIETGEIGLTRHVTDEMLSRGVDRQSGLYRAFATGAVMGDWLVYWERPFIAGIGGPTRAGLRGYGAWKQFKDNPLRLQATVAGISPRLYAFRNKVDIQNTQAWANITRFLGDSGNTVEGLTALKGGKAADGADVVLGVREAGLVDRMIEAMEQGKNFDDAADSLPSAKDHDWYTVQSHLLSEGVKSGVIKGDDVWAVVPKPMRSQVIQVMAAAGVEPTSAIRALNQYILKARKINLHAMEKLLTEGTPEMIAFRSSDQYGNLRKLLLDSVSESGGAVDHVNITMPKLELQAWIAALDPQKPHIKSMEDYFDALRVEIEKGGGPPPPKPKRPKPPGDEPIEVGPIDKEPDEVGPTDYPRDPAPAPRAFADQWEWIEVIESAHGGYWKRKGEGRTVTSPIMTSDKYGADPDQAISVYRHSPVFGETPPAAGEWRGGKITDTGTYGIEWSPIMHAARGADKPAMTLYGYIEGKAYHFTALITQSESAARVTDVREMYRALVKESLAEFKQHLDSDPEAFYRFTLQKSKMKAYYDPEKSGRLATSRARPGSTLEGRLKSKSFRFYKADQKKLGLELTVAGQWKGRKFSKTDVLELPDLTLKKWQKAAKKAASDPDVTPPSGMVDPPKSWSKQKIAYMNTWKKWAEDSGMDPLISKVSESFMTILPNEAFSLHRLEFNPYHPGLYGTASVARGALWDLKNAVRLYMVGKGIKYDPDTSPLAKMTDADLVADARKALDSLVLRRKKEYDPEWSADEMWLSRETDPYYRAQTNQFIEALGPHIAEMVRRERGDQALRGLGGRTRDSLETRAQRLYDELFETPRVEDPTPSWQQGVFRHHVYAALREAETAVRQHEYFKVKVAHTFIHEMTHVLHYSVLSEKELKALRRAYNRERRNKFPNWRRSEDFKGKWNKERSFGEWLADTVSDYWISGNASRHGLFTQEEVGLLQTFIRRTAYHLRQLFSWRGFDLQKAGFPKEIIDLLERLTKQALDETTGQVGIRPREDLKLLGLGAFEKLGPAASVLNRISDEKMVSASASAKAPHWVQSISDMPEEAATAAAHQIARNYASVGSRAYDDIVSYILTNGREGKLNSKILDDFKPSSPSTVPSTGPAKLWRIFYDSKFVDKEGVSKLLSSQEVWNSLDASLLYQMMKSGDINMLFNNGGQLLRRFLGPRDYRHLIRELETKGRREHLTPDGEVAAQKAFKSYIETGKASGPLLPLFEQLYLNLQSYWLRFSKDRDLVASPEIRAWFDKWLAPDLNLRPLAAEITERVLSRFKQVRIAEPEELLKRLEEGMVGLMGRKEEFWRVPLDTPTVRHALGITEYTREMDVVDVFSRAVGYVAGEHARIMSGPEGMHLLTARSIVPQSRVKRVQEASQRRLHQLFNGRLPDPVPGTGAMAGMNVSELSPARAAAFRVFLRSLSSEPLANILPIRLLDESTDLSQVSLAEMNVVIEVLLDIEAGVASSRTHYSERISPTLAVAMWNGLKQMSVNSEKYSEVMKKVSGGIRTRFSEVSDLSDLGPFQRQVVEMTTRELGGIPNEMLRWLIEYKAGNKDATLHEMYLSMKNQLEPPVRPELVELIMGRPATPTDKGAKGWVIELERFHGRLEADPEGAALPAQRRREALLGKADDEVRYEDPTGGDIGGSFLDHILDNLPNLQRMMEQEKSSHPIYGRLTEHDHHSLHILQTYKDSLAKYRRQSELGAPPKQLDEMLSEQDFYNVEEALYYVLDRIRRQKERITQRAMKIGRGLAGDTDFADAGFMTSTDVQGMYYRMFYGGKWIELFEDFGTRTGMATGLEKTTGKAPEVDPGTALVYMIATLRADEVLEGLAGTLAKYGIAKDVRELTANYASSRVVEGQYSGINRDLFHGRIQFYIERILSFQMSTKKYQYTPSYTAKAGDTLESIAVAHGVRVEQLRAWNVLDEGAVLSPGQVIKTADAKMLLEHPRAPFTEKLAPVLPAKETRRAKARGAPEDFYGNVHDLEAYTVAVNIVHQWGFRTAKEGFDLRVLPDGSRVFAPKAVWKHLDDAMDRATGAGTARGVVAHRVDPTPLGLTDYKWSSEAERKMAVGRAVDAIGNMFPSTIARIKMGVTTGIILPNPAYFTGVFLGAGFQAMQGLGPVGFFKMMRNPRQTGAVVARLWKEGSFAPDAPPIVAKNGKTYTVEMLAELAEAHGLKSSFIHAETMKAIASDIREFHPGFWNKMRVGRWAKNWQKTLIESATALDNYWRVSVFIHEIRMGKDPSAAAAKARLVGYDYAALTKFEKKTARNTIMFYSYMRKNMDLFWDTLLTHPERLIGQMRLLRGIHTAWLEDDPQIVLKDYLHGRLPTYFKNTTINTHKYSQWMFISPPLPMMDALDIYIDLYDLVAFKDEEALRGLATRAAPWVQAPFVLATGKDIFWDKELNEYNKIPPWLMEMDLALTGGGLVHGVFGAQLRPHNDLSKADISGEPEHGWYHARNGRAWWIWRSLLQTPGAGRSMDTISYMDRANLGPVEGLIRSARWARRTGAESGWWSGVPEMREGDTMGPRTGLTKAEEFAGLLGFKPIHVPQRSHQTAVDSIITNRQMRQILARERLSEED